MAAFPSWFLRIECDRYGKVRMVDEKRIIAVDLPIRTMLTKMRHDGCGGRAGNAELLTGIGGVSSLPVRKILADGLMWRTGRRHSEGPEA